MILHQTNFCGDPEQKGHDPKQNKKAVVIKYQTTDVELNN